MERNLFLLVLSTFLYGGDSFYYWAKVTTQNSLVTYEEFFVSPAMNKEGMSDFKPTFLCDLKQKKLKNQTTFTYLDNFKSTLFDCFLSQSVKVYTDDNYKFKLGDTKTHIIVHPTPFTVVFKEDFATIYLLKKDK